MTYKEALAGLRKTAASPEKLLDKATDAMSAYDAYREIADPDATLRLADSKLRNKMTTARWKQQKVRQWAAENPDDERRAKVLERLQQIIDGSPYFNADLKARTEANKRM